MEELTGREYLMPVGKQIKMAGPGAGFSDFLILWLAPRVLAFVPAWLPNLEVSLMNGQKHKVPILILGGLIRFYKYLGFSPLIANRNLLESAVFSHPAAFPCSWLLLKLGNLYLSNREQWKAAREGLLPNTEEKQNSGNHSSCSISRSSLVL